MQSALTCDSRPRFHHGIDQSLCVSYMTLGKVIALPVKPQSSHLKNGDNSNNNKKDIIKK